MRNQKIYRWYEILIVTLLVLIVGSSVVQWYRIKVFDRKPVSVSSELPSSDLVVVPQEFTEKTDSWESLIQETADSENLKRYTGATFGIDIANHQNHRVKDWTLRIDVQDECYLNGFWCGKFEVHQFRNEQEIVELVDIKEYDLRTMKLEHNPYTKELYIRLLPGDYLVYYPSAEADETIIKAKGSVGIGMILYFTDNVDLSKNVISYYNDRRVTEGAFFKVILGMIAAWLILTLLHVVSVFTYKKTKQEVESLTQSVINGLSIEYKTLWLINVKEKTIQLVRNLEETDVKNAVSIAKGFQDYDTAIKYYVDHYVDEKDRERVWREVSFENLLENLTEERFFTVSYLHHPYQDASSYFQMAFTMTQGADGNDNIILAYRDVDNYVREDQLRKKQLEDALAQAEEANQIKSIFLANMSHEIRTPINAILGMDTMILRESNEENVKAYAKDIRNASNTLLALINDILDFSKIESGKMEIIPVKYQLDSVINDLMNMAKPKADEKGLDLELVLNPDIPAKLIGDEIRVKQIMMNLLSNAIKYTRRGKVTWIIGYEQKAEDLCELIVSVKDTGIGIKEGEIEKLFSPYERLDSQQNQTIEGTGLGLNITQNLLEKMDSKLEVESEYGVGSTFSFRLKQPTWGPEAIGNHLVELSAEEEKPEKFHAPNARILAVDDVEMNLIVIQSLLKRIEIEPEICMCGRDAVQLAKENKYDLILLDAMMPEMSGEQTLAAIRKEAEVNKDTPIIVLTANAIVGAKEQYLSAGFSDYLSKPVKGEQLEDMIQHYLPADLMILPGPDGFEKKEKTSKHETDCLAAIGQIAGIDTAAGIEASGGEDTYIGICRNFADTAKTRIGMIQEYYEAEDAKNYAIQTHALKSSARLIGALGLSELALRMETAGKAADWEAIHECTEQLIALYQSVSQGLKDVFVKQNEEAAKKSPKKELSEKKLKRNLRDLEELIEAYDFESAKALFAELDAYQLPADFWETYDDLKAYMAEVEYEKIGKAIHVYLEGEEK